MKQRLRNAQVACWGAVLLAAACSWSLADSAPNGSALAKSTMPAQNAHSLTLPHFEPELPAGPGRDAYLVVCVSCHSPRYVTMQPFFPQRQWEETVDKMAKVFGAQMDQSQRAAIVQYLVATHGPDAARSPAGDEDSDFAPPAAPISPPEPAPVLNLATETLEHARQLERGAALFQQDCAACHGPTGRGDGFIGPLLLPKPKDLASTRFSVEFLSQVLWNGKRGTAMPSWRTLPQADLSALAAYVENLHLPVRADAASSESLQRGNKVFQQNCAPCHGVSGDGKGAAAATLLPHPANFQLKQPDLDYILQVLNHGIPGTGMPAWNQQLSEPDRKALGDFVRSLFALRPPEKN